MRRNAFRILSFLFVIALLGGIGFAGEPPKQEGGQIGLGDALPLREQIGEVILSDGSFTRSIGIHREDSSAKRGRENYYVRPVWAFFERELPKGDVADRLAAYPRIIQDVHVEDATIYFDFKLMVSSDKLRQQVKQELLRSDRSYWSEKVNASQLDPHRWPLKMVYARCQLSYNHEVLGSGHTDALTEEVDDITISIGVPISNVSKFVAGLSEHKIKFVFSYQWSNKVSATAEKRRRATKSLVTAAQSELSSGQASGETPITQIDLERVMRKVTAVDQTEIVASHPDAVMLIQSQPTDLTGKLFDPQAEMTIDDVRKGNPEIDAQLAAYLRPLLESTLISEGRQKSDVKVHEDEHGSNWGLSFGPISVGESSKVVDRLTRSSGISFQKDVQTERWVPHKIKVFKLRIGEDTKSVEEVVTMSYAIGKSESFTESSPVPVTYTTDWVAARLGEQRVEAERISLGAAPVGMMIHFYGQNPKSLEPTYLVCDGTSRRTSDFPELARTMRGESYSEETFDLPDLRGRFLRGYDSTGTIDSRSEGRPRVLGDQQDDALQLHGHTEEGGHSHVLEIRNQRKVEPTFGTGWAIIDSANGYPTRARVGSSKPDPRKPQQFLANNFELAPLVEATAQLANPRFGIAQFFTHGSRFTYLRKDTVVPLQGDAIARDATKEEQTVKVYTPLTTEGKTANFATETRPKNIAVWILIRAK